jgi:hypothetical protein
MQDYKLLLVGKERLNEIVFLLEELERSAKREWAQIKYLENVGIFKRLFCAMAKKNTDKVVFHQIKSSMQVQKEYQ